MCPAHTFLQAPISNLQWLSQPHFLAPTAAAYKPHSKAELLSAVQTCIIFLPVEDYCEGLHGSIQEWDVSGVTDMSQMFYRASTFNKDLSKWDVSAVTDMGCMFRDTSWFNQDLSNWDVSAVIDMTSMFHGASAFKRQLCGIAWVNSKAVKTDIFVGSQGSIASTVCTTTTAGMEAGITHFAFVGHDQGA